MQSLLGTDVEPRPVEVRNLTERRGYDPSRYEFFRLLGVGNASFDADRPGGTTTTGGAVFVHPANGTPARVEQVLVHEFVHATQFNANMLPWLDALDRPRLTNDLLQTRLALVEGGAVYVTDAYTERYLDAPAQSERVAERYADGDPAERLFYARYYFGSRYVAAQVDDPSELERAYDDYPRTTEQLLHNLTPGEEPARNLSVAAETGDEWREGENDTLGELTARIVLQSELNDTVAREAAAGWGADEVVGMAGDEQAYAWVLRMDDAAEADELEPALTAFADERGDEVDAAFAVERVADETVALTVGPESLDATVTGDDGNVTVTVE
ncbi:hypothetical protein G9464_08060 [Halostella sp. JP-L12]|uniref:hypothetical protein n=1 Tax=Halostella TaxID=1843185 RepID=UPI000EF7EE15|nr:MULTISPECIES: hypothetical protein [Halostella]NHN47549.1 hypothetical protein [Halostella sp. JP-L12]